jgi:hypothetical protein
VKTLGAWRNWHDATALEAVCSRFESGRPYQTIAEIVLCGGRSRRYLARVLEMEAGPVDANAPPDGTSLVHQCPTRRAGRTHSTWRVLEDHGVNTRERRLLVGKPNARPTKKERRSGNFEQVHERL